MLYELFALSRKAGTAKLEEEVDNPSKGQVFNKYPKFVKNHHALHFLCDTLRMAVSGGVDPMEIDTMMEIDLEVHHTRIGQADRRVEHDGGRAAGAGHRGRGSGGGADHGSAGRAQGGDRREGGGGAGGHVSGDSAVLWDLRTAGRRDGKERGSGVGLPGVSAHGVARFHQGSESDHGGGTGAARDSAAKCVPHFRKWKAPAAAVAAVASKAA